MRMRSTLITKSRPTVAAHLSAAAAVTQRFTASGDAMTHLLTGIVLGIGLIGLADPAAARLVKFEVLRTESPAFEGRSFGTVGTYDRIVGRATIAVAPGDPHNSVIIDIDRAPRNERGLVEAVSDVEILRPAIAANGNRSLVFEVLNRGDKLQYDLFNDLGVINDLSKAAGAGNGFLMSRGFTLVWGGWQGDITPGNGRLTLSPPIVPEATGLSREEFVFDHMEDPAVGALTYPAADLDPAHAKLTVREREADPRVTPSDLSFRFEAPNRILAVSHLAICLSGRRVPLNIGLVKG